MGYLVRLLRYLKNGQKTLKKPWNFEAVKTVSAFLFKINLILSSKCFMSKKGEVHCTDANMSYFFPFFDKNLKKQITTHKSMANFFVSERVYNQDYIDSQMSDIWYTSKAQEFEKSKNYY